MKQHRGTLRGRLTLVYGTLFLVAGLVTLLLTWALVQQQLVVMTSSSNMIPDGIPTTIPPPGALSFPDGQFLRPSDPIVKLLNTVRTDALRSLITQGAIAVVLVGGLTSWIGWLVAGHMLRPLATITDTARRIAQAPDADRRIHERIGLADAPHEIMELANTFDGMLARLDTSFDGQRRFIANASHELRTPLTLNRALIEVSTSRSDASADVQLLGNTLLDINARHEQLIEGLLLLARSEQELTERRFLDLADIVEHVVEQVTALETAPTITVETSESPTVGDAILLEQLVRNLLNNSIQHNLPTNGWVHLDVRSRASHAVLTIANSGPIIARYELKSLVEPFRRLGTQRTSGSRGVGLGLSIVQSIVEAHNGTIDLDAPPTGGLVVTVTLPGETYGLDDDVAQGN